MSSRMCKGLCLLSAEASIAYEPNVLFLGWKTAYSPFVIHGLAVNTMLIVFSYLTH